MREIEILAQECILAAIRESIPTEAIIKAYLDESVEQDMEVIIEPVPEEETESLATKEDSDKENFDEIIKEEESPPAIVPTIQNVDNSPVVTRLTFNDVDQAIDTENNESTIMAPKDIDRLEEISEARNLQRKLEEAEEESEERIKIGDDISIDALGIVDLVGNGGSSSTSDAISLDFDELPPI
jgi:hypothetical protein